MSFVIKVYYVCSSFLHDLTMLGQKLREQRDCHEAAVGLMETLADNLPFKDIIPGNMQDAHVRLSLQSMLGVMEQVLRFLLKYANTPAYSE